MESGLRCQAGSPSLTLTRLIARSQAFVSRLTFRTRRDRDLPVTIARVLEHDSSNLGPDLQPERS
jgi:hypothetical protein